MTRRFVMEFERPLVELEGKLEELRRLDVASEPELAAEIERLAVQVEELRHDLYTSLTPWARVQMSRHPDRPKTQDFIAALFTDVFELRGDRLFGDDESVVTALATLEGRRVMVLGHRKGKNINENIRRRFGSPQPEGFRKARRAMQLADKAGIPVVSFLDTAGAYPGVEAEERGQAWAIAENLATLATLGVPVVAIGIGEGGSGGALAIGFGDRLIMLENAYYSVSSPEACASILYRDAAHAEECAGSLMLTAADLSRLGLADRVVPEPPEGAHTDPPVVYAGVQAALTEALEELASKPSEALVTERYERLRTIGTYVE